MYMYVYIYIYIYMYTYIYIYIYIYIYVYDYDLRRRPFLHWTPANRVKKSRDGFSDHGHVSGIEWRYTNPDPQPQRYIVNIRVTNKVMEMIFAKSLWAWVWVSAAPLRYGQPSY